jgi:hypothetical protein
MGKWCRCPSSLIDADRAVVGSRADRHLPYRGLGSSNLGARRSRLSRSPCTDAVQFGAGQLRFNLFPVMRERRTTDPRPLGALWLSKLSGRRRMIEVFPVPRAGLRGNSLSLIVADVVCVWEGLFP